MTPRSLERRDSDSSVNAHARTGRRLSTRPDRRLTARHDDRLYVRQEREPPDDDRPQAAVTAYANDELDRLTTLTSPQGVFAFGYESQPAETLDYPNGIKNRLRLR